MRLIATLSTFVSTLLLSACITKGTNPADPYEPINRKIHNFNMAFDAAILKPPAKFYRAVVPLPVRTGVNNAYNNVLMLPSVASDLLQAEWRHAIKDSWRFLINSTLGVGGIFDVADSSFQLPPHYNDLGLTFAKWGDKHSPYIVIPFLGPSTIRDGMAMPFDYALTPYPYIHSDALIYSLIVLRYIDIRAQLLESEPLLNEAFDKYTFIRDAYLQHRNYLITGEQPDTDASLYVDETDVNDYVEDESAPTKKPQPKTSSNKHASHSAVPTRNPAQHG